MNQLAGKINTVTPRPGYTPSLDIQLEISNSEDDEQVHFVWMLSRVAISFLRSTNVAPSRGEAMAIGTATPSYTLPQFRKSTTTNFLLPFDERLLTDIETARKGSDVALFLSVTFSALAKNPRVVPAPENLPQAGFIADPRYGGQEVVYIIPRSQWAEIIQGLNISVVDHQKRLEEYEQKARQTLEELETTLEAAKEAAKLVGVAEHAKIFEEEAVSNKRSANLWLTVTTILVLFAGVVAYRNFVNIEHLLSVKAETQTVKGAEAKADGSVGVMVQLTIAKLVVLSILLTGGVWAGRIYKSHRHNFVINRHRSNALRTFQTFATGTADLQTKNAVLLQATTCIFAPQNTGYISPDKESETYPQILEIVRGVGSSGKGE